MPAAASRRLLLATALLPLGCSPRPASGHADAPMSLPAARTEAETRWVGTWSAAPQLTEPGNLPPAPGLANRTLRQVFFVSIGGEKIRVHLSNAYGDAPLVVHSARVARSTGEDGIDRASDRALRFLGSTELTVPPGETVSSDPLEFPLAPMSKVALTLAFGATPARITGHPGSRTTSFVAGGNVAGAVKLPAPDTTEHWYFATGIDVLGEPGSGALVTLGDSLTDGRGSTTDGNDRWPDQLSRRLRANPDTARVAVLNQGIGGNAVLSGGLGPTAVERFERDVLAKAGVRWLIVFEGVNDIGGSSEPEVAEKLIGAYRAFVTAARARGLRAYGATILPFGGSQYDTPEHETARQHLNAWIRTPGNFDAVIDFDARVRDPADPARLLVTYDSGDHLHLSPAGYLRLAEAVDFGLFAP